MLKLNAAQLMNRSRMVGQGRCGSSFLGLLYTNRTMAHKLDMVDCYADAGITVWRFFNCSHDVMRIPGHRDQEPAFLALLAQDRAGLYDDAYFERMEDWLHQIFFRIENGVEQQIMIPRISMLGYVGRNHNYLPNDLVKSYLIPRTVEVMDRVFDPKRWMSAEMYARMEAAGLPLFPLWEWEFMNEGTSALPGFDCESTKAGMPGQMDCLGRNAMEIVNLMESMGVAPSRCYMNVIDDSRYPAVPSTADALSGAAGQSWSIPGKKPIWENINLEFHKIHCPADVLEGDMEADHGARSIQKRVNIKGFDVDTDGNSATGFQCHGFDPSPMKNGTYLSPNRAELKDMAVAYFTAAVKYGKFGTCFHLPRYHFNMDVTAHCRECDHYWHMFGLTPHNDRPAGCPLCGGRYEIPREGVIYRDGLDQPGMDTILGIVDGYREVHGEPPNVGRWTAPGVKRIGEAEEPIEPEEPEIPDPEEEEIIMSDKKTWQYLIPSLRLPVAVDVKGFWSLANFWDKAGFCVAAPIALAASGLILWGVAELIAWIF